MIQEEWRDVIGYEGLYEISNYGNIRSKDRYVACCYGSKQFIRGRFLSANPNKKGYLMISLYRNHKSKVKYIHRLVAEAFIPNPNNLPQVNHKDECKTNNIYTNLEWCDATYNLNYGTVKQRISERHKDKGTPIVQMTKHTEDIIAVHINSQRAMDITGIDASAINKCCMNRPKFITAGGYRWKYFEDVSEINSQNEYF